MKTVNAYRETTTASPILLAIVLNCVFWIYFWFAFAGTHPNDHFWGDHPVDPYIVLGHAIGLSTNPLSYGFMKAMFWVEFPSFCVATMIQMLLAKVDVTSLFFGISLNGYRLMVTMLLSFLQWYLIGRFLYWLARRFASTNLRRTDTGSS